jgi:hypothetical protein
MAYYSLSVWGEHTGTWVIAALVAWLLWTAGKWGSRLRN